MHIEFVKSAYVQPGPSQRLPHTSQILCDTLSHGESEYVIHSTHFQKKIGWMINFKFLKFNAVTTRSLCTFTKADEMGNETPWPL